MRLKKFRYVSVLDFVSFFQFPFLSFSLKAYSRIRIRASFKLAMLYCMPFNKY